MNKEADYDAMQRGLRVRGQRFVHDSECCKWVGKFNTIGGHRYDVWTCDGLHEDNPTVICRFGNNGPDYYSFRLKDALDPRKERSFYRDAANLIMGNPLSANAKLIP